MKWFKHRADMHADTKLLALRKAHGLEGYALWVIVLEHLAGQDEVSDELDMGADLLAFKFGLEEQRVSEILDTMAEVGLIDKTRWSEGIIAVPNFLKYTDDYRRKQKRTRNQSGEISDNGRTDFGQISDKLRTNSGETPEKLRRNSGETPDNVRTNSGQTPEKLRTNFRQGWKWWR